MDIFFAIGVWYIVVLRKQYSSGVAHGVRVVPRRGRTPYPETFVSDFGGAVENVAVMTRPFCFARGQDLFPL